MPFKSARQKVGAATANVVAPITGGRQLVRPELKRAAKILVGGLVLAFVATKMAPAQRGAAPLLCMAGAVLVALVDFHRHDRRVFGLLVAVSSLAGMVALAASSTAFTRSATVKATVLGNQASMAGPGQAWAGVQAAGDWSVHTALPWLLSQFGGVNLPWSV